MKKQIIAGLLLFSMAASMLCGCANNGSSTDSNDSGSVTDGNGSNGSTTSANVSTTLNYKSSDYSEIFASPTAEYRWDEMNHSLTTTYSSSISEFLKYINNRVDRGQGGVVTNVAFTEAFTDDKDTFTVLGTALKAMRNKGLNDIWLYDEYGYPSGHAGGRVTAENEEYIARGLVCTVKSGNGYSSVTVKKDTTTADMLGIYLAYAIDTNGKIYKVNTDGNTATFKGTSGEWNFYVFQEKYLYEGTHAENNGYGNKDKWKSQYYSNLLDADATEAFIKYAYKPYVDNLEDFDKITGIFTDEPSLVEAYINTSATFTYAQISWVDGFEDEFKKMHGYDISENLHYLFSGSSDEAKIVRVNYRQTVAELFANNYFKKLSDYCEENGTKSSGHLLNEDNIESHAYYYGDLMRCIREIGIPGVDCLRMTTSSYLSDGSNGWPWYMAVKYASAITTLTDKDRTVMLEFCPTDYDTWGKEGVFTESEMLSFRATMNMMFFNGATKIHSYTSLSKLGTQEKTYADYFARVSYISTNAKWDSGVALYYPINTIQANSTPNKKSGYSTNDGGLAKIGVALFSEQLDYTMVDNKFIEEAKVEDGKLYTENVTFTSIIMNSVEVIPLSVLQKLTEFEKSGGTVIWIGSVPTLSDNLNDIEEVKKLAATLTPYDSLNKEAISKIKKAFNDKLVIDTVTSTLYVGRYILNDAPMYWIFNNRNIDKELKVSYEGAKGFDIYDPMTGTITQVSGDSATVQVGALGAVFVTVLY